MTLHDAVPLLAPTACLLAGVLIGLRWKHRRFLTERQKRREAERRNAMFDTQALRTDLDVVGPVQPKPTLHEDGQVTVDPLDARHLDPCGWSDGDTVCGDPAAGTITWPEGPVDLCPTHLVWARESEDAPVVSD